jgi:GT2 family glycosyltransferase
MKLSVGITTRNRTEELDACLRALWNSAVKPHFVVVSDDSPKREVQQQNRLIVERYPGTIYIKGPQAGVCANRNNAVNAIPNSETDLIVFLDDDICVESNFIALALERFQQIPLEQKDRTIFSGLTLEPNGEELRPGKLTFRGYFTSSDTPETVAINSAVFPRSFFAEEQWDENIFFGYEDAELCLRALKRGYKILSCPELKVFHHGHQKSTLAVNSIGNLTAYQIYIEAARLYVGIKRYKNIFPDLPKLLLFSTIYLIHMSFYLFKHRALKAWFAIVRNSRIERLW